PTKPATATPHPPATAGPCKQQPPPTQPRRRRRSAPAPPPRPPPPTPASPSPPPNRARASSAHSTTRSSEHTTALQPPSNPPRTPRHHHRHLPRPRPTNRPSRQQRPHTRQLQLDRASSNPRRHNPAGDDDQLRPRLLDHRHRRQLRLRRLRTGRELQVLTRQRDRQNTRLHSSHPRTHHAPPDTTTVTYPAPVQPTAQAGNSDPTPASYSWTVQAATPADTTPPETTISSGPASSTTATDASFAFAASEPGASFKCSLDN